MQQLAIDKILMTLSVLLTSPENNLQMNSQPTDLRQFLRGGGDNISPAIGKTQNMRNLTSVIDKLISNQMNITDRIKLIAMDIQTFDNQLSITDATGCFGNHVGKTIMKLPKFTKGFPVLCASNQFGNNWLLVAHINDNSNFVDRKAQSYNNTIGKFYDDNDYFIGFDKLRAITDTELCEFLMVEVRNNEEYYDYYDAIAFDSQRNYVKMLGQHQSNRFQPLNLQQQLEFVDEKLSLLSSDGITIYLRKSTLDVVLPQFPDGGVIS